jgi:integrase/recombinase XerD
MGGPIRVIIDNEAVINRLAAEFGGKDLRELTSEEILSFLTRMTEGSKQQTKRTRFSHLSAFFSFIRQHIDPQAQNPCDTPMMKKLFNHGNLVRWNTFDKETVDEIIFKASNLRNRIILELMARGGAGRPKPITSLKILPQTL